MAARVAIQGRTLALCSEARNPSLLRLISSYPFLSQEPQLQEVPGAPAPLPPNPSTGSPFYQENWRNPSSGPGAFGGQSLVPIKGVQYNARMWAYAQTADLAGLKSSFANLMLSQNWTDLKQFFEFWIRSLDASGKPNRPDVDIYNHYLRANLMMGASAGELLDLAAQMEEYQVLPNTASYNLVLKAMFQASEYEAAEKLLDRMLQTGCVPDDESYNLVISLLLSKNQIESSLKYMDLLLNSGYMLSSSVFTEYVRSCVSSGRLDALALIIEKCKTTDQNKALSPSWKLCNYIADVATQSDHSKLAFFALEFFARWMVRGENTWPTVLLSVDEGLVISALGTAGRTCNSDLIDASLSILKHSLRQKRAPNPETYLAKIYAYAALGKLQRAFSTLNELETVYGNSEEVDNDLFSPFTSLYPLVVACCRNGFSTLDLVYVQLENLSHANPPYKSVAALNCVILGCANIWDLDRAYETFEAITEKFQLTPDIHSYNALICAFGKLKKTTEACKVFDHLVSLGVKPNATMYAVLIDVHLANRDPKAAVSIIHEMANAGFTPSKYILKKVRRRCSREIDLDTDDQVQSLARRFGLVMGAETRRELLYNLDYGGIY
ncbi:Pentatricopeptide repeat-containing protein [Apostasia shenzhenica]|uniref:Pentatricopeptide repeat-containing protein n=1 Tax=Apostasia shenzhenica TaxID=1088818 RepID=A0A2I0A484_9ASPA|nr:Pentatricopeptide repeat-containing protein [Apostasia shenzhenica]